jgi:signal transduction histidine kinase
MLTRLDVNLVLMRKLLEQQGGQPQSPELLEKVAESHSLVSGTADLVRNLCTELRPAVLDDLGLVPALEWQVRQFQARTNIRCETRFEEPAFMRNEQATSVFRIFQEILTNVARHSQASKLRIALETRGGEVFLEVKDNGRGMRPEQMADSKSLGLLGMRERASLLGGAVLIDGQPGKGTTVSVRVPLGAPA